MKNNLSYIINAGIYGYSKYDFLLAENNNIGENGRNLTIVVLTYNRSSATLKLLQSVEDVIPEFEGEILLADNGSNKDELQKIYDYKQNSKLNIKIVEFKKNLGVADGRNKAFSLVKTDWILSLDNDIYFLNNPLEKIQYTISLLGVKFLNLPLLSEDKKTIFSNGGSLFSEYDQNGAVVGGGSLFAQCKIEEIDNLEPSLSTFLLGGASVLNKNEFLRCGKFDDNMFIGFEDIDFSITLFNQGLKIGNCACLSLVHDHTIGTDEQSLEYEKTRFSHGIIKNSALYLERKRGFKIWNANTEMWIKQRQKDLGLIEDDNQIEYDIFKDNKRKIALIVDVKDWCFWNIATVIKNKLSNYYDFEIIPLDELDNNIAKLLLYTKDNFDLVHIFWRGHLSLLKQYENYIQDCGLTYQDFYDLYINDQQITTSVYDHLYLDNLELTNNILNCTKNYTVSSKLLNKIYLDTPEIQKKPAQVITDGVDLSLFKPDKLERFADFNRPLVIGWVGNSNWSKEIEDFKGFHTILKKAITELKKEGILIQEKYADRQIKMIPHDDMPNYYTQIDVLLCASKCEGTPNPILEAMACGVPIITTNVGIVQEAFGEKQQKYIVNNRTVKAFKEKIKYLSNHKEDLKCLSNENLKQIKNWTWDIKVNDFKQFFDKNIKIKEK